MADLAEKIALLFVGWLLGLLAPIVVDGIRRRRENTLGRAAIVTELNELAATLSLAAYSVRSDLGTVDRAFLEWIKNDLELHAKTPDVQQHITYFRTQLSWSDEEREQVSKHLMKKKGKGTVMQHYPVPLLDARVSAMLSFNTRFQRQLLQIRRNVALLDALVDRAQNYHDMTFKVEGDNYRLVVENQDQACAEYAKRAQMTVDLIRSLPADAQ
jgi:hypothetical protein